MIEIWNLKRFITSSWAVVAHKQEIVVNKNNKNTHIDMALQHKLRLIETLYDAKQVQLNIMFN